MFHVKQDKYNKQISYEQQDSITKPEMHQGLPRKSEM